MSSLSYEDSKSIALKTILLLGVITIIEVVIALVGKGYIGGVDYGTTKIGAAIIGLSMIGLSLFKAIKIIFEFMHMKYEVPALPKTVLLPMLLLVWGIIAFGCEGDYWNKRRGAQIERNKIEVEAVPQGTAIKEKVKHEEKH